MGKSAQTNEKSRTAVNIYRVRAGLKSNSDRLRKNLKLSYNTKKRIKKKRIK